MRGGDGKRDAAAERYARALFDVIEEGCGGFSHDESLEQLSSFSRALDEVSALRRAATSPTIGSEVRDAALGDVCSAMGFHRLVSNFIRAASRGGRLGSLSAMVRSYRDLISSSRGEVSATAISAVRLSSESRNRLTALASRISGKTAVLETEERASLLGGVILQVGSRRIDASLRGRLDSLAATLRAAAG